MTAMPKAETLLIDARDGVLHVTLNRPERRNALSSRMVEELIAVFEAADRDEALRAVVLRGAGGSFCAGADVKDLSGGAQTAQAAQAGGGAQPGADPKIALARNNRRFGDLTAAVNGCVHPVVAVVEGAVMGGGIGLVCASDIAIARADARFGLPETGLGVIPAQIAPFVLQRIGFTHARRLMLTGARLSGVEAARIGLVHEVCDDEPALEAALALTITEIRRCAPRANAATKQLLLHALGREPSSVLDHAARVFAEAAAGDEAREGTLAFVQKRKPSWAE
jgi:isohexenylglutaconyl-CoA hydratase